MELARYDTSYFFASGHLLALVLLDLIGPSRSHAAFGSRRGRLSHSHDRVRSETRNKPASPTRPICSLSLGFLGAINFPQGSLFASSCAAVSEHTLQYSQCPLFVRSRYNLSWGNLEPTFIVCEKAQRCRRRLFARSLFRRAPTLSLCGLYRGHRGGDLCLCRTIMPRPLHIPSGP